MTHFSPETRRVLAVNGWQEERRIDTSGYEQVLRAAGYDDYKPACEFLQQYGDLEVQVDPEIEETCLNTRLSPIMTTTPVSHFSKAAGRTLYIIGSCYYDFMTLLMDSSGRVYRNMEMTSQNFGGITLYRIAASGEEAIAMLILEDQTGVEIHGERIAHKE